MAGGSLADDGCGLAVLRVNNESPTRELRATEYGIAEGTAWHCMRP